MNRWCAAVFVLALVAALALRLPALDARPLHNDEGVNATKLAALLDHGDYRYDPHEYHGPTLHYFSAALLWITGVRDSTALTDSQLRMAPVFFGIGTILLLLLLRGALGDAATAGAALVMAVSPAMVFYSRYFIHEMLLVFFTLLTLAAGWRCWQSRKTGWAVLAGIGLGLMWATKETFVFAIVAMFIAGVACGLVAGWRDRKFMAQWPGKNYMALIILTAMVVGGVLFTSFFSNLRGVLDSVLTYVTWFKRADGSGQHGFPWSFYFERLVWFHGHRGPVWTEAGIILLAVLGSISAFAGNRSVVPSPGFLRFISFYTATLAGIYSVIPYKTPWCLLGFWSGALILAGAGVAVLWRAAATAAARFATCGVLFAVLIHLGWQSWRAGNEFASDRANPYVFAQTLPRALELVERVKALALLHPDGKAMPVQICMSSSEWPLPWYLRDLQRTGWWSHPPDDLHAPVVISDSGFGIALDEKAGRRWLMAGLFELRPGVFLELYVQTELWKSYVESSARAAGRP